MMAKVSEAEVQRRMNYLQDFMQACDSRGLVRPHRDDVFAYAIARKDLEWALTNWASDARNVRTDP